MTLNKSDATDNVAVDSLNEALIIAKRFLTEFSEGQDFINTINTAFGQSYSLEKTQKLRRQWLADDFSQLPQIILKPQAEINGAQGAFSKDTNEIYLAEEYVSENHSKPEAIADVLLEEIGHFVDNQINTSDAPGDEGQIFSELVRGERLGIDELRKEKAEDDKAIINLDGRIIEIEQASVSDSGGYEGSQKTLKLNTKDGALIKFYYEHYTIPDNFILRYEGKNILETGFVGGSKTATIQLPKGKSDELDVIVATNDEGTAWQYSVEEIDTEIKIEDATVAVAKNSGSSKEISFKVTLTKASPIEVTVEYFTLIGTGIDQGSVLNKADYTPVKGTLTFAPGETTKEIKVKVLGDTPLSKNSDYEILARDTAYRDWQKNQDIDYFKNNSGSYVQPYGDLGYRVNQFFNGSNGFEAAGLTSDEKFFLVLSKPKGGQIVEDPQAQKNKLLTEVKEYLGNDQQSPEYQSITNRIENKIKELETQDSSWTFATGTIYDQGKPPVLAVRGTEPTKLSDLWSDANPIGIGYDQFIQNKGTVQTWLNQVSNPEKGITFEPSITGHSLGGALTQWIAADYSLTGKLGKIVTFNSPGIALQNANQFNSANVGPVNHFIASSDLVSMAGLGFIQGNYTLSDWNLNLSNIPKGWIVGEHTHPMIVNTIEDGGDKPPSSTLNFIKNYSSVTSLSSLLFTYLPDPDYFITQLIVAAIPKVGPLLARAMTFRGQVEAVRSTIGQNLYQIDFALELGKTVIVKAWNAAKQWGPAAWDAISEWGETAWGSVKDWSVQAWNASTSWIDNAWDATTKWGADAWDATTKWGADAWDATTKWTSTAWNFWRDIFSFSSTNNLNAKDVALESATQIADPWEATAYWSKEAWQATTQWSDKAWEALGKWSIDLWQATTTWTPEAWKATTTWSDDLWQATTKYDAAVDKLLFGGTGDDTLNGGNGNDLINGFQGSDSLSGNNKNDTLNGGPGGDTLNGGPGIDSFFFNSPTEGVDTIVNLEAGDRLIVSSEGFDAGLTAGASLKASEFVLGNTAADSDDRFIYKATTGELFFDRDGTGSAAQQKIATLTNKPILSANDIYVDSAANSPIIKLTQPSDDVKAQQVNIKWEAFDPDSQAKISLYYDTDDQGFNGQLIASELLESDGEGNYIWKPTNVPKGDYYIYAKIVDENNNPVYSYAKGLVQLQTAETADLSVTQTTNVASVSVEQNLTYTVKVTNNGSDKSEKITLVETLPEGVTFVSASITPTQQEDNVLTFALNDLNNGQSKTVDITVKAPILPDKITSTAEVSSYTFDPNSANDSDSFEVNVVPPDLPDLSIERVDNSSSSNLGQSYDYTLTIKNNGTQDANNVVLNENLPSEVNYISSSSSQGYSYYDYYGNNIQANLGKIAPNQQVTVKVTLNAFAAGQLITNSSVTSTQPDLDPTDNTLTNVYTVNSQPPTPADLQLTQTLSNPNPKVGDQIFYNITLLNTGPGIASGIKVKDLLPPELSFLSATPEQGTYDAATGIWDVGNLKFNVDRTLTIAAKILKPGTITNNAEIIAANETDPDSTPGNNIPTEDDQAKIEISIIDAKISIGDVSVTEGNTNTTTASFKVTLDQATTSTVAVDYSTVNDSAIAPTDYNQKNGALTFAPGETIKTIAVEVKGDNLVEFDENFKVNLSNPNNAILNTATGIGTIINDDSPAISISNAAIQEGDTGSKSLEFVVTLDQVGNVPLTVKYTTTPNTAKAPSDYTNTQGILTFNPGEIKKTVTVSVNGDTEVEADETFFVKLGDNINGTIAKEIGTGTIINNDLPGITLSNRTITEGNTGTIPASFVINLDKVSNQIVTVQYATQSQTASAPDDYQAVSGILSFNPGQTSKTVAVQVKGDTVYEAGETFSLNLTNPDLATLITSKGIGTIVNDDLIPKVTINDTSVVEGNLGVKNLSFGVSLSNASYQPIVISYNTSDNTATSPRDYKPTNGTLTFNPGETKKTIDLGVNGDLIFETDEKLQVKLTNLTPANANLVDNLGVGTIVNDDLDPKISIEDIGITEGNNGIKNLNLAVKLSNESYQDISVKYSTVDGTAVAGSDYNFTNGTLSFKAGETNKTVTVQVKGDVTFEPDENLFVKLSNPINATLNKTQAQGTILNDDPITKIEINDASLIEGNSGTKNLAFTVTLTNPSFQNIRLAYATTPGTASAGNDYVSTSGNLTFAPGEMRKTIQVAVRGDTLLEANETFDLNLTNLTPTGGNLIKNKAVGTIINDDPLPKISINDVSLSEGNSGTKNLNFTVSLNSPSFQKVGVNYATVDGTASALSDYIATNGSLTFNPGEINKTITVKVKGDTVTENDEIFFVNLNTPTNGTILDSQGKGVITNDDAKVKSKAQSDLLLGQVKTLTGTHEGDINLGDSLAKHGDSDYAVIVGFDSNHDKILLDGSVDDYYLASPGVGLPAGVGIFLKNTLDLIAILPKVNQLSLESSSFSFV